MLLTLISIIHIIVSVIMVIAVLLQVGKGASIGSTFGGGASSQTIFGSAGPATLLAKVTYGCAGIFMLTSLFLTYSASRRRSSSIMRNVPAATAPAPATPAPVAPAAPAGQPK